MTEKQKVDLMDYVIKYIQEATTSEDLPTMVGTLNKPLGIKGFKKADVGHPVFEYKDRYIVYLESERELTEKVYDHERQQFNTKVGFFTVAIPYYKDTLKPCIDFLL